MDRSSRQKMNKETVVLNDTLEQMDLTDIFRTFRHKTAKYTFFSSVHRTFSRIDNILGYKTSLDKLKKNEIISNISSDYIIKLEIQSPEKNLERTQIHGSQITCY